MPRRWAAATRSAQGSVRQPRAPRAQYPTHAELVEIRSALEAIREELTNQGPWDYPDQTPDMTGWDCAEAVDKAIQRLYEIPEA